MTKDDKEIVSAMRNRLADRVGKDRYELWFGASTRLVFRSRTLSVEVANRFNQDWLRSNFRKDLEAIVLEVCPPGTALEFRVDESLAPSTADEDTAHNADDAAATSDAAPASGACSAAASSQVTAGVATSDN